MTFRSFLAGVALFALLMWLLWPGPFDSWKRDGPVSDVAPDTAPVLLLGESMPQLHGLAAQSDAPPVADAQDELPVDEIKPELTLRLDTVDARTGGRLVAQWNVVTTAPEAHVCAGAAR